MFDPPLRIALRCSITAAGPRIWTIESLIFNICISNKEQIHYWSSEPRIHLIYFTYNVIMALSRIALIGMGVSSDMLLKVSMSKKP